VSKSRIETREETVARQAEQLAALQRQLDEAKQQVQDIAVKAIEGASGARQSNRDGTGADAPWTAVTAITRRPEA
jgi:uncharacterized protein involved in exopolysaccharide biosynthesis